MYTFGDENSADRPNILYIVKVAGRTEEEMLPSHKKKNLHYSSHITASSCQGQGALPGYHESVRTHFRFQVNLAADPECRTLDLA